MTEDRRTAITLHTIDEIVADSAVADAWAFAEHLYRLTKQPYSDVVSSYNGYTVEISVSPPHGATTMSVWSASLQKYVTVYADDGVISAQRFPEAWPAELPLIHRES